MRALSVVLMGHDVRHDGAPRRSVAEAGVSLPIGRLLELLEEVRARGLRFVGLGEFLARRHREPLALLSFDDGYRTLHDELFPRLCERGIPALVFLISGPYQQGYESFALQLFTLRDHHLALAPEAAGALERLPELQTVMRRAGATTLGEVLGRPEAEVARSFSVLDPAERRSLEKGMGELGVLPRSTLSREEIERMQASGWVEFGAHSVNHVSFQRLPQAQVEREIVDSCRFLAEMLGRPGQRLAFAYPYGGMTAHARRLVARHCSAGFSTRPRCVTRLDPDSALPRLELSAELPARLDGAGALRDGAAALLERVELRLRPAARWIRDRAPALSSSDGRRG